MKLYLFWNQGERRERESEREREVVSNKHDTIIKNKKRENMLTVSCGNKSGQKREGEGSTKETQIQEFMYRGTTNVGHEMFDYTSNNWRHQNSNERFKEKYGSLNRKTFNPFTTKDSNT